MFLIQLRLRNPMVQIVFAYDVYEWKKKSIEFCDVITTQIYNSHLEVKNWDTDL